MLCLDTLWLAGVVKIVVSLDLCKLYRRGCHCRHTDVCVCCRWHRINDGF